MNLVLLSLVLAGLLAPVPARAAGPASDPEPCRKPYSVVRGDALSKIAKRCDLTLSALLMANPQIKQPGRILVGQAVFFPRKPEPVSAETPTIVVRPDADRLSPAQIELLGVEDGSRERWIDIDLSSQTVSAYEGNTVVRTFLVSTGVWRTPTITGRFRIYQKFEADDMRGPGYFFKDVPYTLYFHKDYGLHGTYWHDNFGTPMSHGCVNLAVEDAKWLFNFAQLETMVNVHY
jgi:lipoprotein-anchoring transpeptidase ErfK/SrfK